MQDGGNRRSKLSGGSCRGWLVPQEQLSGMHRRGMSDCCSALPSQSIYWPWLLHKTRQAGLWWALVTPDQPGSLVLTHSVYCHKLYCSLPHGLPGPATDRDKRSKSRDREQTRLASVSAHINWTLKGCGQSHRVLSPRSLHAKADLLSRLEFGMGRVEPFVFCFSNPFSAYFLLCFCKPAVHKT